MAGRNHWVSGVIAAAPMILHGIGAFPYRFTVAMYLMLILGAVLEAERD